MKYRTACVCSARTGEVLYIFTPMEILGGKQYMIARCVGRFYAITDVRERYGSLEIWVK